MNLPELNELQRIVADGGAHLQQRVVCEVSNRAAPSTARLPVLAITLGNPSLDVPAVGFFGGVHGLERIGAEVVIAHLASLVTRLGWDSSLHRSSNRCAWCSCRSSTPVAWRVPRAPTRTAST